MRTKRFICTVGLVLLSIFLIFSGITACQKSEKKEGDPPPPNYPYTVSFEMPSMKVFPQGNALPLVEFFKKTGAKVFWKNSTTAIILYDNTSMTLYLQEEPVLSCESSFLSNLLRCTPGNPFLYQEVVDQEIFADENSICEALRQAGKPIFLSVDTETKTVTVTFRDPKDLPYYH